MRLHKPLEGVKVVSFEAVFSLPSATRLLADMGASVVRIPMLGRWGDGQSSIDQFVDVTDVLINKSSLRLDLKQPEAISLARDLIAQSDVVCNNFRPGVMERLGLGATELRTERPELIVLQLTGYGTDGPWRSAPALGPSTEAAAGMNMLIGEPNRPPTRIGTDIYADIASGRYAVLAILAALQRRRETGEGQYIDLSMYEACVHLIGDKILGSTASGERHPRIGNRDTVVAPQGLYPAQGEDEWVAISVTSDDEWRALVEVTQLEALARPELADVAGRHEHHDEIDAAISEWTQARTKDAAAELLQASGVPAGPVTRPADVADDVQHQHREFIQYIEHDGEILGKPSHGHMVLGWKVEETSRQNLHPPKADGHGSAETLKAWLGLSDEQIERLEQSGAVLPAQAPPEQRGRRAS